ncbi:hypothetical protein [Clostridium sp.]
MKNTKIASILIGVSMTVLVFSGCSGRTKIPNVVTKQQMNNTIKPIQSSSTAMTELYSKTLKQLVTAKTITQTQSSKVLAAIKNNMTPDTVTVPNTVTSPDTLTTPNGPNTVTTPNGVKTPNTVTGSNTVTEPNTTPTINGISSLVKSKVITQAQADTITLKIQEAMKKIK